MCENDSILNVMASLELIWDFADTLAYAGTIEVLIVPVKILEFSTIVLGKEPFVAFFHDGYGGLDSRLLLIQGDDEYLSDSAGIYPQNFTGNILQINWDGCIDHSVAVEGGQITKKYKSPQFLEERYIDCYPGETSSIRVYLPAIASVFWTDIFTFSVTEYDCFETGEPTEPGLYWHDWFGFNHGGGDIPITGNSGNGVNTFYVGNYYNLEGLTGDEYLIAQAVNKFKEEYGLVYSGPSLWDMIQENCSDEFGQTGPNPLVFFHQLDGFLSAPHGSMNSCLKNIIEESSLRILALGYDLHLDRDQLLEIFSTDCIYGGNFEQCALAELRDWIGQWVEYTDAQRAWMESYPHITPGIVNYILNNQEDPELAQVLDTAFDFMEEKGFDGASGQALELAFLLLQNDAYSSPFSPAKLASIEQFFNDCCPQYLAVNSALWMQLFLTEESQLVQAEGYSTERARLQAIYTSMTEGWAAIQHLSTELDQLMAAQGIPFPETQEEWEALAYIMWEFLKQEAPTLLLECSPVVGDFLSFKNAFVALQDGEYLSGSVEFIAGLVGIIGPGKVFKFLGKVTKVAKWGFKALKLFKDVQKFFKGIFSSLMDKVGNLGWSVRLEDAADKVKIVDNLGDEVFEVHEGVIDIKRVDGFLFIDIGDIKSLPAVAPTGSGYINSSLISGSAMKIKVSAPGSLKSKVDDILATTDSGLLGQYGEELSEMLFNRNGYSSPPFEVSLPSQIPGGNANGFDNVFIKYAPNGEVDNIIINEAKVGSGSGVALNAANMGSTPPLPQQMSDDWLDHVITRMFQQGGDLAQLAGTINAAKNAGKLTKTATFVKKPSGEINILKLDNF